jgi:phage tail tape-measure protein
MSTLKKDHILGAGSAALAGGAAGAALGALVGGVPGLAVGAAAGGALGAVFGDRASEAADRREDLGHFEQIYRTMPYYVAGHSWHDYAPAYRYGLDSYDRFQGQALDAVDTQLQGGWEANARFGSRLVWNDARPAVAHAWQSLDDARARNPGGTAH